MNRIGVEPGARQLPQVMYCTLNIRVGRPMVCEGVESVHSLCIGIQERNHVLGIATVSRLPKLVARMTHHHPIPDIGATSAAFQTGFLITVEWA